jgi:hypothetical protein
MGSQLLRALAAQGFDADDLSDNEAAKSHVRYCVGGRSRARDVREELLRFEFPEKAGAAQHSAAQLGPSAARPRAARPRAAQRSPTQYSRAQRSFA